MSKIAKQLLLGLGVILLGLVAYIGFLTLQNQGLAKEKSWLNQQVEESSKREKTQLLKLKDLQDKIAQLDEKKQALESKVEELSVVDVEKYAQRIKDLTAQRDALDVKLAKLQDDNQTLSEKLEQAEEPKVMYKYVDARGNAVSADQQQAAQVPVMGVGRMTSPDIEEMSRDAYWAQVLKDKASLEIEVRNLQAELSQSRLTVADLKKINTDLQLNLEDLQAEKDEIERRIQYGKDLSDSLSLELARAQNDKKFLNDRLEKIAGENSTLRDQIRELTSTKLALEKNIVRLQDQKSEIEAKLDETENVIQGRINEIWEIKDSLEQDFGVEQQLSSQVQLPPIVVSDRPMDTELDPNEFPAPGINGNIVSVNNDNNFVIIDIGQDEGIHLGDSLNIYRGAEYVAGIEVIQVRQDIAAADIISKVSDIQVGDAVR